MVEGALGFSARMVVAYVFHCACRKIRAKTRGRRWFYRWILARVPGLGGRMGATVPAWGRAAGLAVGFDFKGMI